MTPAELVRDIEKVSETLVLAVGALERLSLSLREPMERPDTVGCPTVDASADPRLHLPLLPRGTSGREAPVRRSSKPWDVPGFEACQYGEVDGIRVVALDAPHRPGRVEIAIRTRGPNPQSIAVSPENASRLLQALCLACVDIGMADEIIREILANEDRPMGTATTH